MEAPEFEPIEEVDTAQYGRIWGLKSDATVFCRAKDGGFWEPEVAITFGRLIRPGSVAIDAGANIGLHTIAMAARSAASAIVAFEPHPEIFRCLALNAKRDARIAPLNKALGCAPATVSMHRLDGTDNPAGARIFTTPGDHRVEVGPLDALSLANVSLIKIDVEGGELDVIEGARETIERERPALIVEILPGANRARAISTVEALGYRSEFLNREDVLFTRR